MSTAALVLAGSLLLTLLLGSAAEGAGSCLGRKATITSNTKRIVGSKRPDVIVAGGGNNVIDGKGGNDRICGGGGNDTIDGDNGSDRLSGDAGKDTITGFRGRDRISGGGGDDTIHGDAGTDDLDGGGGSDRVFGESGNETLSGGAGARDFVDEGPGDGRVQGGAGDFDVLVGGAGNDVLDGGPGAHDIASYSTSDVPVNIDLGAGQASGAAQERLIAVEDGLGGAGDDDLTGSDAPNRLDGGPGNDRLTAVGSGDQAFGGQGSDNCRGRFASQNSCGNENVGRAIAVDLVQSIDGSSTLAVAGRNQADVVNVAHSGNRYTISGPDDVEPASQGACRSENSRTVVCTGVARAILALLAGGDDEITLQGIPNRTTALLDGDTGSDTLRASSGDDTLLAGPDNAPDAMFGGGGNDTLFAIDLANPRQASGAGMMSGGAGSDLLIGGQPCDGDTFDGGPGRNDSASFARVRNDGVVVDATIGGAVTDPDAGRCDAGRIDGSVEKIEGSTGPDRLTGDNSNNDLLGRGGNDSLDGKGGFDRCVGGGGRDRAVRCERKGSIP